jgi:hypothetical protein
LTRPDRSLAAYDSVRADMEVHMRKDVESGDAPEVVAETVVKAATAAVPRRRYAAGRLARQVRIMRRLVLLCHKLLARFDSRLSRMEILTLGGGVWVSNPTDAAANHGLQPMSRH